MHIFALAIAGVAALTLATWEVQAQSADRHDDRLAEDWAWKQLYADNIADFDDNPDCNPKKEKYWDDPCRRISPQFLINLLARPVYYNWLSRPRVRLRHARVIGSVTLSDAEIMPEVWIDDSWIDGTLQLADSHWNRLLSLEGTRVVGDFSAWRMRTGSNLLLDAGSIFDGSVQLAGAKISGNLDTGGSRFKKDFNGDSMSVSGHLFMQEGAVFLGYVVLRGAKISGDLAAGGSRFERDFDGDSMRVSGNLLMRSGATFIGNVLLRGATISNELSLSGSHFVKNFNGNSLIVGSSLFMTDAMFGGEVNLVGATIGSNLEMSGSSFAGPVMADDLSIKKDLFMRYGARFREPVSLAGAEIGASLDLRYSMAVSIDLSSAKAEEFLLVGLRWWCGGGKTPNVSSPGSIAEDDELAIFWPLGSQARSRAKCDGRQSNGSANQPTLTLRNFHVADFQDNADAWPPAMDLEGFHYDRLGGFGGTGRDDMRERSSSAWADWLEHDSNFSTQPYTALSAVLAAAGHRDAADAIEKAARDRECNDDWTRGHLLSWFRLTVLALVAGYGIGSYTFRVLYWVAGFTALGVVVLCFSQNARRHNWVWRTGASLHRLLPIIELYKEFTDFFNNPPAKGLEPRNLEPWQAFYFAVHAIVGWALGLILLAAMSGLTQKS